MSARQRGTRGDYQETRAFVAPRERSGDGGEFNDATEVFPRSLLASCTVVSLTLVSAFFGCDERVGGPPEPSVTLTKSPHVETSSEAAVVTALSFMEQEQYADAIKALEFLGANPEPGVAKIRAEARYEAEAMLRFRAACLRTNGRDLEAVYERCRSIETESRYYNQGCCAGANERCGKARLAEAVERLNDGEPAKGLSLLQALINDDHMNSTIRERARVLKERTAQRPRERSGGLKRSSTDETPNSPLSPWLDGDRPSRESSRPTTLESWLD